MGFKKDFIWGSATASYQIEGAAFADGKKASVWDECVRRPDFVKTGATGDVACDHYNLWREDIDLMSDIGLKGYRFSVSWPRVLPCGIGEVNQKGLDFYDRLTDGLLEKGIEPFLTLFHWDFPLELYLKGGWLNPDSPKWFAEYAAAVAEKLSDRVAHWFTLNEPQCFIDIGHRQGRHAPGIKLPTEQVLTCSHNVLLAHGFAVQALRQSCKKVPKIGFAPIAKVCIPKTESDVEYAREKSFECSGFFNTTWWSDPVFFGKYPDDGVKYFERYMPKIGPDDMDVIKQELDFYGMNVYHGQYVTATGGEAKTLNDPYIDFTGFDWPVTPEALYWGPKFIYERYKKPIYITENGMSGTDFVNDDGKVIDDHRIVYTSKYLRELKRAALDGVDIDGYFHWSLMDNFEWAEGYTKRFGLIHVDFHNGRRTLKESAKWYGRIIAENGGSL